MSFHIINKFPEKKYRMQKRVTFSDISCNLWLSWTVCKFQGAEELKSTDLFSFVSQMSSTVLNFLRFSFRVSTWEPEDYSVLIVCEIFETRPWRHGGV